jgi:hypothetical protein
VAAAIGALVATPAFADVTVSPTTTVQGSGDNLTFKLTNDGNQPITTVKLTWPADTPIAEVYPLSVNDWAPKIEMQKLSKPLPQLHGGTPVTDVAKAITWISMPGHALAPGKAAALSVAAGPLPTLSSVTFTLATTYADGKAGPTLPATVTLKPGVGLPAAGGHHNGTGTGATGSAEEQLFADTVAGTDRGTSVWSIGGWVAAGLVLIGALVYFVRNRRPSSTEDDASEDDASEDTAEKAVAEPDKSGKSEKEPVSAGKWSLKN